MENEIQATDADTSAGGSKGGRANRRNKILPQTERDKDQENIDNFTSDTDPIVEQSKSVMAKVDDNKQSTPITTPTNTSVNSSTPRRKKDPLANLHSNLSPKYIGFVTPTSNLDNSIEERPRTTRRRHNLCLNSCTTTGGESLSRESSLDMTDVVVGQLYAGALDATSSLGYVRRTTKGSKESDSSTPEHKNGRKKDFVSPIDKLLRKNGSMVDCGEKLPLDDGEDMFRREHNKEGKCDEKTGEAARVNRNNEEAQHEEEGEQTKEQNNNETEKEVSVENQLQQGEKECEEEEKEIQTAVDEISTHIDEAESQNKEVVQAIDDENSKESGIEEMHQIEIRTDLENDADLVVLKKSEDDKQEADAIYISYDADELSNSSTAVTPEPTEKIPQGEKAQETSLIERKANSSIWEDLDIFADESESCHTEEAVIVANDCTMLSTDDGQAKGKSESYNTEETDTADEQSHSSHSEDDKIDETTQGFKVPLEIPLTKELTISLERQDDLIESHTDSKNIELEITADKQLSIALNQKSKIQVRTDLEETESNSDYVVDNISAKSPSAISMDSAKGSSILNEGSWMSYKIGDLFWGQIYTYCYWPCMVCKDPDGKTISTKEYNAHGDQHIMVHVRFFADNGRRNWVKRENLMPFTTLQSYQERLDECREKHGPKSAKYKLLVPKKTNANIWWEAVNEMEMVSKVPNEQREEKFYEIFEKSKAFQKIQKQRRKSLYVHTGRNMTNSDAESLYGSNENVNNLTAPSATQKRERSVSPFSPAFSPIKSMTVKKRKLSEDLGLPSTSTEANNVNYNGDHQRRQSQISDVSLSQTNSLDTTASTTVANRNTLNGLDIFQGMEFKTFHAVMRDFVMDTNQDEILEKSLLVAVRNIWALKQVSREQMERKLMDNSNKIEDQDDTSSVEGGGAVKRLSSRLKSLLVRKSLISQQLSSSYVDLSGDASALSAAKTLKDAGSEKSKKPHIVNRPILEVIDDIFELDSKYLFKGLGRDPVCKYCHKPGGNLKRCAKNCHYWLHSECLNIDFMTNGKPKRHYKRQNAAKSINDSATETNSTTLSTLEPTITIDSTEVPSSLILHVTSETDTEVVCKECANNEPAKCMVCNLAESGKADDPLVKCSMTQCDRAFHPACCKYWPQSKITISKNHIQSFRCPSHVCHTCVSDDPKGKFQHISNSKLTKCVKCPATFHTDSTCIPAGSQILTTAHIICPRHASSKIDMTVNVNWCFICVGGGQVVCCETCPTAVHAQCLKIPIDPNEGYICEECESGRMPLYGEMVWAKFNNFRWWPAIILPPTEIPHNILRKTHNPSDFVVRFFGTHDHGWISRRRVYLYLEGDGTEPPKTKSHLDLNYIRGVEEAKKMYEIVKAKKSEQRNSNENKEKLHPQPYVRIRANRAVPPVKLHVDMESVSKCDCDPNDVNPCGPDTSCLNRVLYHECNPKVCPAGKRCQNQMFESRISPNLDVVYMKERGFGLVCREPIAAGTFIIEYVGEIINDDEFRSRMSQKSLDRDENFYFLSVEKDYIIDAGPKGNLARFMNHSCDPNCETQKWSVNSLNRVGLFAIKNIPENTELTFNYHWDDLLGNEKKTCFCGSKKCAGQIGGKIKDDSKESSPSSDAAVKTKGRTKNKSKLKPLKRLHATTGKGKRKALTKLKANAAKHKSNKMAAAAALAAALSKSNSPKTISNDDNNNKDVVVDVDGTPSSSPPQAPDDVFC